MNKKRILVLCTGNSCRSQMAEGLMRYFGKDTVEVFSAGSNPAVEVNPLAVEIMQEISIDISHQYPKHIREFLNNDFDFVITVCNNAKKACPVFPKETVKVHWDLEDPADAEGTRKEQLELFRKTRDIIYEKISGFLKYLSEKSY